jgi:hypothetical protein
VDDAIAEERRAWHRERDAIVSELRAAIAELRANIAQERLLGAHINEKPSRVHEVKEFIRAAMAAVTMHTGEAISKVRAAEKERAAAFTKCMEEVGALKADLAVRAAHGPAVNVRGTWSRVATYRANDIAMLNGASFIARRDRPGPCPGEDWQLLAGQGKRGKPTPGVIGLAISESGLLTVRNGDGSNVKLDLYPLLSRIAHARAT